MAATAFRTINGFRRWASEHGLSIHDDRPVAGRTTLMVHTDRGVFTVQFDSEGYVVDAALACIGANSPTLTLSSRNTVSRLARLAVTSKEDS